MQADIRVLSLPSRKYGCWPSSYPSFNIVQLDFSFSGPLLLSPPKLQSQLNVRLLSAHESKSTQCHRGPRSFTSQVSYYLGVQFQLSLSSPQRRSIYQVCQVSPAVSLLPSQPLPLSKPYNHPCSMTLLSQHFTLLNFFGMRVIRRTILSDMVNFWHGCQQQQQRTRIATDHDNLGPGPDIPTSRYIELELKIYKTKTQKEI